MKGCMKKLVLFTCTIFFMAGPALAQIIPNKGKQPETQYRLPQKELSGDNYSNTQPGSSQNKQYISDSKKRAEDKRTGNIKNNPNVRKIGEDHPFRGGVEKETWQKHEKADLLEMDYYAKTFTYPNGTPKQVHIDDVGVDHTKMPSKTQTQSPECMDPQPHPAGVICIGIDFQTFEFYAKPLIIYWIPFQMIESHDIPAVTGYGDKEKLKDLLKDTDEKKKENLDKYFSEDQKIPEEQNKGSRFQIEVSTSKTEVSEDAKKSIFDYELEKRYHNITIESQGYRYAEFHGLPTWYHEYYRDDPRFGSAGLNQADVPWCHQGSIYGVTDQGACQPFVPEVPLFFSEEPFLIGITRWISLSHEESDLQEFTPERGKNYHTMELLNINKGKWTSKDLAESDGELFPAVDGEDDPGKEVQTREGFNDPVGGFVNFAKSLSPAKVAELMAGRGLRFADAYLTKSTMGIVTQSRVSELYYTEKNGQTPGRVYHPWSRFDEGAFKRDKQQVLRNERMAPGCIRQMIQDEWLTDWKGPEYGAANDNLERDKNHWNVFVNWRYIQCCPCGTIPIPPVPYQTF